MESPSYSKQGDLFISPCNFSEALFPVHQSPYDWKSCNDAYTYSWTKDFKKELTALSSLDSAKMINSMGFCPQNRCQLFNLSSTGIDGMSPEGLCYTKIENGGLSYGACAFHGGIFNSGVLLGYYYKTQPTPKPIYKKSRIVLGNKRGVVSSVDDSIENFINANQIYPGLIGTQCPLASRPSGFHNTVDDVKRMIIENNITLWVQLAPSGLENFYMNGTYIPGDANCGIFPLEFFSNSSSLYSRGVTKFKIAEFNTSSPYVEMTYTITAYSSVQKDGMTETTFEDMSINRSLRSAKHVTLSNGNSSDDSQLPTAATDDEVDPGFYSEIGPILLDELVEVPLLITDEESSNAKSILSSKLNKITFEEIPLTWKKITVNVRHVWYHKWKDFRTPPPEDQQFMKDLAEEAASVLSTGRESVAVNCLSGRGRTGTFSAIVLGKLLNVKTHSQFVDVIVGMRENRDGLVETPAQFKFAAAVLGLPDTSIAPIHVPSERTETPLKSRTYAPLLGGVLFVVLSYFTYGAASQFKLSGGLSRGISEQSRNRTYESVKHQDKDDNDDGDIEAYLHQKRGF